MDGLGEYKTGEGRGTAERTDGPVSRAEAAKPSKSQIFAVENKEEGPVKVIVCRESENEKFDKGCALLLPFPNPGGNGGKRRGRRRDPVF